MSRRAAPSKSTNNVIAIADSTLFQGVIAAEELAVCAGACPPDEEPGSPALVPRRELRLPAGISKSMTKAIACPTFFAGQYLQRESVANSEHYLTRTGNEFHQWRKEYVDHLVRTGRYDDPEFRERYVTEQRLSPDAQALIRRDALSINPEAVYATELFLSVDRSFAPLEHEIDGTPGQLSRHANFLLSGTLDLLLLEGRTATIVDPKSGFSTTGVSDDEPAFYAALVFAHFPMVEQVHFRWDFVRVSALRRTEYTRRSDFGWMQSRVREVNAAKDAIYAAYRSGSPLDANPLSGLCPYCQLTCPLRPRWESGELALAGPQNEGDAVRLAQLIKVCEDVIGRGRQLLITWLDQAAQRELPLGSDWVASLRVDDKREYPLVDALNILGLDLVDVQSLAPEVRATIAQHRPHSTPQFDVPLASLQLGGLTNFCKTKKSKSGVSREALKAELGSVAKRSAATTLTIRKQALLIGEALQEATCES